jgi:hypothetical protein
MISNGGKVIDASKEEEKSESKLSGSVSKSGKN